MTPKSLLRLPAATSTMAELETGGFKPVIDDHHVTDRAKVRRLALCSGKVYYDLEHARDGNVKPEIAVARVEQFYPFPGKAIAELIASYPNVSEIVWTQEEPENMGGWSFMAPRLREIAGTERKVRYIGRVASASPATGSYAIHHLEQDQLVHQTLEISAGESVAAK